MRGILIWILLGCSCLAQAPWDGGLPGEGVKQSQVVFLSAKSAEVAPLENGVAILAEDLADTREYGVIVTLPKPAKWIEIHPSEKPFPPMIQAPLKDGRFLVRGKPGEKFYVSVRGEEIPTWFEVFIAPRTPEPPPEITPTPPPGSWTPAELAKLSKDLATGLGDNATAQSLKRAINDTITKIESMCNARQCPTLPAAKSMIVGAIESELLTRKTPNKDWWTGWRKPISDAITKANPADLKTYLTLMKSVASGL